MDFLLKDETLLSAVRALQFHFLQRHNESIETTAVAGTAALASNPAVAVRPRSQWASEMLLDVTSTPEAAFHPTSSCCGNTPAMWSLVAMAIRLGERGIETATAGPEYVDWHRQLHHDPQEHAEMMGYALGGLEAPLDTNTADNLHHYALKCVLGGCLAEAAEVLSALRNATARHTPITDAAVNDAFVDVIHLVETPFRSSLEFDQWRLHANNLLEKHKEVLGTPDDEEVDAEDLVVAMKTTIFDVLTMLTGDTEYTLAMVQSHQLSPLWYPQAVSCFIQPDITLAGLSALYDQALQVTNDRQVTQDAGQRAFQDAVSHILCVRSLGDVVAAMEGIWMTYETDGIIDDLSSVTAEQQFGVFLMAAHLADLCADLPSTTGSGAALHAVMPSVYTKNSLMSKLAVKFLCSSSTNSYLWQVGVTYLAYCPLIDVQSLKDAIENLSVIAQRTDEGRVDVAVAQEAVSVFLQVYDTLLSSASGFQKAQRQIIKHRCGEVNFHITDAYFAAYDGVVLGASAELMKDVAEGLFAEGQYAMAIQLMQRPTAHPHGKIDGNTEWIFDLLRCELFQGKDGDGEGEAQETDGEDDATPAPSTYAAAITSTSSGPLVANSILVVGEAVISGMLMTPVSAGPILGLLKLCGSLYLMASAPTAAAKLTAVWSALQLDATLPYKLEVALIATALDLAQRPQECKSTMGQLLHFNQRLVALPPTKDTLALIHTCGLTMTNKNTRPAMVFSS